MDLREFMLWSVTVRGTGNQRITSGHHVLTPVGADIRDAAYVAAAVYPDWEVTDIGRKHAIWADVSEFTGGNDE